MEQRDLVLSDPYGAIDELRHKYGATCSASEFQSAVNVVFHRHESAVYDAVHAHMWESLPRQFECVASAVTPLAPSSNLRLLDVGAGTGLATTLLLDTPLGNAISDITLLDTSKEMLRRAESRGRQWKRPISSILGEVDAASAGSFDVVVACSVLHHIPDLAAFCASLKRRLRPGGFFLHLQDPNADYLQDPQLLARCEELRELARADRAPVTLSSRIAYRIKRLLGQRSYLEKVNDDLLRTGIIKSRMEDEDIWAVTDVLEHTGDGGVSVRALTQFLHPMECLLTRSYSFFGKLRSSLPIELQSREDELWQQRDPTGWAVCGAWRLPLE